MRPSPTTHLAGLALLMCAGAAIATEPKFDVRMAVVSFTDADIASPAAAAALYQRIQSAAEQACQLPASQATAAAPQRTACVSDAIRRVVARVAAPELTRIFEQKRITP
jgi:UrcA family protein